MARRTTIIDTDIDPASSAELAAIDLLADPAPSDAPAPVEYVVARWTEQQTVMVPGQGLVRYGDPITVTVEQLAQAEHPTIVWSDTWTPNPAVMAASRLEG